MSCPRNIRITNKQTNVLYRITSSVTETPNYYVRLEAVQWPPASTTTIDTTTTTTTQAVTWTTTTLRTTARDCVQRESLFHVYYQRDIRTQTQMCIISSSDTLHTLHSTPVNTRRFTTVTRVDQLSTTSTTTTKVNGDNDCLQSDTVK